MSTQIEMATKTELARPLKVLVPLIKEEIKAGEDAGLEHYRAAGEMLLEAKAQVAHGAWKDWFHRQRFAWSYTQATVYMSLAAKIRPGQDIPFRTLSEASGDRREHHDTQRTWVEPVREIAQRVNVEALQTEYRDREREQRLLRALGGQLIDIGYKVLAAKLHPDKPDGSKEAMARLNRVRDILRRAL